MARRWCVECLPLTISSGRSQTFLREETDGVKSAYAAARQTVFHASISRVHAFVADAVTTLGELLQDTQPPNVRLGAARTLLDIGTDRHDAETLAQRLDAIEAMCRETD